jgi:hypothetical protein
MMAWLEGTALATWTRESPSIWAYPTILTLHTVGLGVVVGASAVIDFRLLGFAPRISLPALSPLFRVILYGFLLNAVTGCILFMADATAKSRQPVFYIKLTLIGLALWNMAAVRRLMLNDPGRGTAGVSSSRRKSLAVLSLLLWAGAITAGRLMAYL